MPSPLSNLREKLSARSWHWKDAALAVLAILLLAVSAYAFREPLGSAFGGLADEREAVKVFDVVLDRQGRQHVDILFDRPLGEGHVGEILDPAPATISPALGGSWKWQDTNALRFQPSGGFPVASQYTVSLILDRIVPESLRFEGDPEILVRTDPFLVEAVDAHEEPALEGRARVIFRGEVRFNYPVNPEVLAPLIRLVDPATTEPVPVELEVSWPSQVVGFRTGSVQKQKDERTLRLVIDGSLTSSEGNAPLGQEFAQEIPLGSSTRLSVWSVEAQPGLTESTVTLRFSSPVSAAVVEKHLTIDPAVPVRLSSDRNQVSVIGALKPGSTYRLALGQGLPATDEAVLREPWQAEVALPDLEPSVDFQSQGMFLSAAGEHAVALESVNVPRVRFAVDRVYLNNLFFLLQYGGFSQGESGWFGEVQRALGDRLKDQTFAVQGGRNQRAVTRVDLDGWIDADEPGLYRVSAGKPGDWQAAQRWILLTDLGLVAKRGAGGEVLVWVASLRDLAPVQGAQVTLLSDQNQPIGSGRTDGSGFWRLRQPDLVPGPEGTRPYLITVENGDDFTFLLFDSMAVDLGGLDVGGAPAPGEGYTAFLYGERDLYRPGETAKGLAVVRDGRLQPPPSMPALLRHRDPQGRELETFRLETDARGLAPFTLDLPAFAATGHHVLELVIAEKVVGQYRFQVEEFIPDRIEVRVEPPQGATWPRTGPGEELAYAVQGNWLFGAPASGLAVESRVRLVDSTFSAAGFEGFSFRNGERQMDDREVLAAQGQLDDDGRAGFAVTVPTGAPVPSTLDAVITARVQEQGGRGVTALTRVPVHPYPYYLGLRRTAEDWPDPGTEVEVEYVAVDPAGKPLPSGGLRADLFEDRWNTVLRRTPSGTWRYDSSRDPVLVSSQAIPAGQPRGTFRVKPPRYGAYRVVLTDPATQASSQVEFYAAGWGTSPWAIKNPGRLELDLDREEYAPGDTAVVQVRAPFSGKLLVTVERDRVFETQVHTLTGNTARLEIPIRDDYRPNAYVTATLVRPVGDLEPGSAGRAFGAVPLPVDRAANRLDPEIRAPEEVRPETELAVEVRTRPGAVVTLAAVDEGILQLAAQRTADPFSFFYRKLALGVGSFDTFSLTLPEVPGGPAGGGEGAEGMAQYVRTEGIRRVEPVAFWSGPLVADAEGVVRTRFRLPEFQGALRLMAVAVDGARFGASEQRARVRSPLVLLTTLPRILSFQETLKVPVTVRNDTGRDGAVEIALQAEGPVQVQAPAAQTLEIPNGRERTVYFEVKTGNAPGDARFTATAAGNGERSRSRTGVGVRADLPPIAREQVGTLERPVTELAFNQSGYRPGTVRRELRVGPFPVVQLSGKLRHLLTYPYGCLEQTVSAAFPLIYLGDLAKALAPDLLDPAKTPTGAQPPADPAEAVQHALRRIAGLQLPNGGFALWPGARETHPWGSLYATHFLVEARRAGHPADPSLHNRAVEYVARQVKAKGTYGSDELKRTAYGLYVLARAGRADLGTMDFLREKHRQALHPESKALLAAAYAAAGNPQAVEDLTARLDEVEAVARQTGGNFDSTIRNRALLLLALLDAAPRSPRIPELVKRLTRDAGEVESWTTQEEAFALLALGQFAQRQQSLPAFSGTVTVDGKRMGTFGNETVTIPLKGDGPARIEVTGGFQPGTIYYSVLTRGIPTDEAFRPEAQGLEIAREVLTRDGKAADLKNVRQGDLLVLKVRVRSTAGPLHNVAVVNLLPTGLEVENPRLKTTEQLPWIADANLIPRHLDLRDDRILIFTDLPANSWQNLYTLVRAVAPGEFRLPPVYAEAMYDPGVHAVGARGAVVVGVGGGR